MPPASHGWCRQGGIRRWTQNIPWAPWYAMVKSFNAELLCHPQLGVSFEVKIISDWFGNRCGPHNIPQKSNCVTPRIDCRDIEWNLPLSNKVVLTMVDGGRLCSIQFQYVLYHCVPPHPPIDPKCLPLYLWLVDKSYIAGMSATHSLCAWTVKFMLKFARWWAREFARWWALQLRLHFG